LEPPALRGDEDHGDSDSFACPYQIIVEGGERQISSRREFQIRSIIRGQPISDGEAMHIGEDALGALGVRDNIQRFEFDQKFAGFRRRERPLF
jgi:hypothetical protein